MTRRLERWFVDEDGSNLIEYALLAGAIGFAGVAAFSAMSNSMNTTYVSWDEAIQSDALVEVPNPQ
jgi:Flp pilus assembly pilin Flp